MPRSDLLTASYRSGVRFVGLILPAPPCIISLGLIPGKDCGRLYSMFSRPTQTDLRRLEQLPSAAKSNLRSAVGCLLRLCWGICRRARGTDPGQLVIASLSHCNPGKERRHCPAPRCRHRARCSDRSRPSFNRQTDSGCRLQAEAG